MFSKAQFFIGIVIGGSIGFAAGYSKAREIFMAAMAKAMAESRCKDEQMKETEE